MEANAIKVLLVEDRPSDAGLTIRQLEKGGFAVDFQRVESEEALRAALGQQDWDIVLSDFSLPDFDANGALAVLREYSKDLPFIVVSGTIGEDIAIALMRAGASDYLMKNNLERLASAVRRELQNAEIRRARRLAEAAHLESEIKFKQLFKLAPVPLCYVDQRGAILDINQCFEQSFGYSHAELPNLDAWWQSAYPDPDYRNWVMSNWHAAAGAATQLVASQPIEYRVSCKNGEVRSMVISGIRIGDKFLASFFDVSERKQAEMELKRLVAEAGRARSALLGVLEDQRAAQAELREKARLLSESQRIAGIGSWRLELPSGKLSLSEQTYRIYQLTTEDFDHRFATLLSRVVAEDRPLLEGWIAQCRAGQVLAELQFRIAWPDASVRIIESFAELSHAAEASTVVITGTMQDVTERAQTREQLRLNAQVFEASGEGIVITDANNVIVSINRAFTTITGYTAEEAIGNTPSLLASGKHGDDYYAAMWSQIIHQGHWQGEVWNFRKDGTLYPQWLSISVILDQAGAITHHIGILSDLTHYKMAEERIKFLSNFDPLTQLPNRALLRDRAQLALAGAKRTQGSVALLYIDLDRFKIINDSLGPSVGDWLLKQLAERLTGHLHSDDTLCRQGGDEFILLLPATDAETAAHVARKLLDIIAQPFSVEGQNLSLSASIGIAKYPLDGDDFEQLAQSADAALFRAKQSGRNTFQFFTQQMHEQAREVLQIENELRRALEQGEFVLHYQPQVDAKTAHLIGAEALIRWQHPEQGLVPPGRFIPIAEESGLIVEIGDWVLHTAIRQIADWQAAGLAIVPVAVNLSVMQFRQDNLFQSVAQALRVSKLDPALLELEMTEGIAMENSEHTIALLDQLHALGVALSIDDFGTGYSSLSYLKRFRINKLKIDQSFVRHLGRDPEDAAIVTAIIVMATSLGFKTIAEGVETREQLDFLREKHCDEIQGYYYSKPLPAEAFASLLAKGGALPGGTGI